MNAVEALGLSFSYQAGREILSDLSFSIPAGEAVVFAGLSGSGKTTLCYCLCGVIPNAVQGLMKGSVRLFGEDIAGMPLSETSRKIGYVFQNPDDQLICTTVEDELAFGLENLCVEPVEIRLRVDETMARFGLTELALRDPASLSGGQKKLVTIAGVLIFAPDVIILDEPFSSLDEDSRALVREAVDSLKREGRTVISVEHDLSLAGFADRVIYLKNGKLYDSP